MSIKKYSKEFKLDAISLVNDQKYSQSEAAKSLGIDAKLISRWIRENRQEEGQAFRGKGSLTEEQLELRRLREEVRRLTMEKDILKKATAFFAKEMK
jgi:transposase